MCSLSLESQICLVIQANITMFENLSSAIIEDEELNERLNTSITQHFQSFETVFKRYFPELKEQKAAFVRNPFSISLNVRVIPNELQDQFYDHQNHSFARDFFSENGTLSVVVCYARTLLTSIQTGISNITFICDKILCLCEGGFSTLVYIKNESTKSKES